MEELMNLIAKGGPVMWPIAGAALVALGIIIERSIFFAVSGINYIRFRDRLRDAIREMRKRLESGDVLVSEEGLDSLKQAYSAFRWNNSCYARIAMAYLDSIHAGKAGRDETLRRVGSEEIERMEKYFQGLSAISHASPLLGLLGTVTGIISSFAVISQLGGQVDVAALAGGIWEAMLTTAAGLSVAIPTSLAYLYFEKIVSYRSNRMSYIITYLNEVFLGEGERGGEELFQHEEDSREEAAADRLG